MVNYQPSQSRTLVPSPKENTTQYYQTAFVYFNQSGVAEGRTKALVLVLPNSKITQRIT